MALADRRHPFAAGKSLGRSLRLELPSPTTTWGAGRPSSPRWQKVPTTFHGPPPGPWGDRTCWSPHRLSGGASECVSQAGQVLLPADGDRAQRSEVGGEPLHVEQGGAAVAEQVDQPDQGDL